ncbi:MAG: hypothetical protein ACOCT9_02200 [archaeon]
MICETCGVDLIFDTQNNDIEIFEINEDFCVVYVECIECGDGWLVEYRFEEIRPDRI